jgi:glycosyltransferase involved in cell wall biosynthesis
LILSFSSPGPAEEGSPARDDEVAALTVLELWAQGHVANFMRILIEHWRDHGPGTLRAIVTRQFLAAHPHVFEGFENVAGSPVRWALLDPEDETVLRAAQEFTSGESAKAEGPVVLPHSATYFSALLERCVRRYPTRHVLLMNLQENILSLGALNRVPASLSGIIFLPFFFYRSERANASFGIRMFNAMQDRLVRTRLLSHPDLRVVFFLDQAVVDWLNGAGTTRVVYLPDPVRLPDRLLSPEEAADTRRRFAVAGNRKLFLLFGDLRPRKGLWKLFAALRELTAEECARAAIGLVGHAEPAIEDRIAKETAALSGNPISVIRRPGYVSDAERDAWFDVADVVLAPYLRHTGSSGVLLLAAARRKPVISQDFGLMGRLTRENRLGVAIDTFDPKALAQAMRGFIGAAGPPEWHADKAYAFARSQSEERFATVLIDSLRPFMM